MKTLKKEKQLIEMMKVHIKKINILSNKTLILIKIMLSI